ncbi:MAG: type I-C CRISPR-associated endonuclease Cas1c [Candidatus Hydrogenedentales bacterium]
MKKLLNTLYITSAGAVLSKENKRVLISRDDKPKIRVPFHTLAGIVCFGPVRCTADLMGACIGHDISIIYLSVYGRFLAKVQGLVSGNVVLRREQYRKADIPKIAAAVARRCIAAKLANCRNLLLKTQEEQETVNSLPEIKESINYLASRVRLLPFLNTVEKLRSMQGAGTRHYYAIFDHLICEQKKDFHFVQRAPKPPKDPTNALLSFYYTLLTHDMCSALESVGLDPAVGYLHKDQPGRPGLALDLMEELRPYMVDRFVLSLINKKHVQKEDFKKTQSGGCFLTDEARKKILPLYQKEKQQSIYHPFLKETMPIGLLPYAQAELFARYIDGEIKAYPAFHWK